MQNEDSSSDERTDTSTPPGEYKVESINGEEWRLNQFTGQMSIHYLVHWENYSSCDDTWEPLSNLTNSNDILRAWKKSTARVQYLRRQPLPPEAEQKPKKKKKSKGTKRRHRERDSVFSTEDYGETSEARRASSPKKEFPPSKKIEVDDAVMNGVDATRAIDAFVNADGIDDVIIDGYADIPFDEGAFEEFEVDEFESVPPELADVATRFSMERLNAFDRSVSVHTMDALVGLLTATREARASIHEHAPPTSSGATELPLPIEDITCLVMAEIGDHAKCVEIHERALQYETRPDAMLARAVKAGKLDRVEQLLTSQRMNVEDADAKGVTLLMHCAFKRCSFAHEFCKISEQLLKHGANVNATTMSGYTATMVATNTGHCCVLAKLITAGAGMNATTTKRDSALILAAKHPPDPAVLATARLLMLAGADAAYENAGRKTAVTLARERKNEEMVELLEEFSQKAMSALLVAARPLLRERLELVAPMTPVHTVRLHDAKSVRVAFFRHPTPREFAHIAEVLLIASANYAARQGVYLCRLEAPVSRVRINDVECTSILSTDDGASLAVTFISKTLRPYENVIEITFDTAGYERTKTDMFFVQAWQVALTE